LSYVINLSLPSPTRGGNAYSLLFEEGEIFLILWDGQTAGARGKGIPGAAGFVEDVVDALDDV